MGPVRTTRSLGKASRSVDEVLFPPIEPHRTGFLVERFIQEEQELTNSSTPEQVEEGAPLKEGAPPSSRKGEFLPAFIGASCGYI